MMLKILLVAMAVLMVPIIINTVVSVQNRKDIDDIQTTVNFIYSKQRFGNGKSSFRFGEVKDNNELYQKMYVIEQKLDATEQKLDAIDMADKQIKIGENFTYNDEQYVVEAVCSTKSIGNTPSLNVELVKGESVVVRG